MLHLVTGGSGSGKSQYAEDLILQFGEERPRVYIATMHAGKDPENHRRIQKHRDRRASMNFRTIECPMALHTIDLPPHAIVLLEDLSNLLANEQFLPGGSGIHSVDTIRLGIQYLCTKADEVVIVTNEVFSDGIAPTDDYTRCYLEHLGALNQELAHRAESAVEVVYGIPVPFKQTGNKR